MKPRNPEPEFPSKSTMYTIPELSEPPELPEITHEYSSTLHQTSSTLAQYPKVAPDISIRAFKQYINLQLIKSCALLAISELDQALEHVEEALFIAEDKNLFYEISKCHLYRGLCFMGMKRWREAKIALVRGVNVRGWGGRVEGLMREVQLRIDEDKRGQKLGV
ncbi:441eb739-42f7-4602-908b-99643f10aeb1-CDS [Sclerotinia trifoliorum]|uniref:441eb739-42f7-4602-908b-99643f10aeb1-CDS n=1 Tax=Sclerotinia trifoliorum TaxID=28548 RepID=A0A8H2VUL5_9HELO|nr:441eb739-42f7-4602-908b-99643f10aeb1-CDS [Sclerotinia trifoliorum]